MSTRSGVSEGLQPRERGVRRSLRIGVRRRAFQKRKLDICWFRIVVEETTEVLGERDYYCTEDFIKNGQTSAVSTTD